MSFSSQNRMIFQVFKAKALIIIRRSPHSPILSSQSKLLGNEISMRENQNQCYTVFWSFTLNKNPRATVFPKLINLVEKSNLETHKKPEANVTSSRNCKEWLGRPSTAGEAIYNTAEKKGEKQSSHGHWRALRSE